MLLLAREQPGVDAF